MTSQTVTEQPLHRTWVAGRIVSAAGSDPAAAVMNAEAPRERVEPGTGERAMRSLSAVAPQNRNKRGSEQSTRWAAAYLRARGVKEGRARRRESGGGGDTAAWSCDLIIASTPSLSLARSLGARLSREYRLSAWPVDEAVPEGVRVPRRTKRRF